MDHSRSGGGHSQHLGVNKISKAIRKSPLHQPSYRGPSPPPPSQQQQPPPPQPQVYNISKNDFRSIVQQLTGTPSRDPPGGNPSPTPPPPRPPHPKPPSMRLQKIRPPPLTPMARLPPPPFQNQMPQHPMPHPMPNPNPNLNPGPGFFPRPSPVAESPVSAYMKYLESSLLQSDGRPPVPSPGLLPPPPFPAFPSSRNPNSNPNPAQNPNQNPNSHPGLLPSPGSQFVPPSPSSFLNLLSPKSPYPLLSPGFQYSPPLTPSAFVFSPLAQSGILGPGPGSHPPPPSSPGMLFPQSPSGFFPLLSPRWRDM